MRATDAHTKVLHVCGRTNEGGITRLVEALLDLNRSFATRHDLLLTLPGGPEPANGHWIVHRLRFRPAHAFAAVRDAAAIYRGYDAVMIHAAHPAVVLPLLRGGPRRFVFQHGMSVSSGRWLRRALRKLWFSALPALLRAQVVCSTEFAYRKSRDLGIRFSPKRVVVVPFGTAFEVARRREAPVERTRIITIGLAGRLDAQKRQHLVLESLRGYQGQHRIVVLIAGDGNAREGLERIASELPRSRVQVEFLGFVEDMASFYDRLDILAFPSRGESLGLVVLEAFRRGVPVAVLEDVGGCRSLIEDGRTGFVVSELSGLRDLWQRLDARPEVLGKMTRALADYRHAAIDIARTRELLDQLAQCVSAS